MPTAPTSRTVALAALLALARPAAVPSLAYEDYALREGMRCSVCHADERTYLLTTRGREYKRNGFTFDVSPPTTVTPKGVRVPGKVILGGPVAPVDKQLMWRAAAALSTASRGVSMGHYESAAKAAGELQSLAGKMEGQRRAMHQAAADQARLLREAAFQLERALRGGTDRRPSLAPLYLGRIHAACLRCHIGAGKSQEGWSRDLRSPGVAHGPPRKRHRPHSVDERPEGALPSRKRSWDGARR